MTLVFFIFCGCSLRVDETRISREEEKFEGWGGPPETRNQKRYEYYYFTQKGMASNKAMKKNLLIGCGLLALIMR